MESLSVVREKLVTDATITEVVFAEGCYRGALYVGGPEGTDFAQHSLLIRAAAGVQLYLTPARPVEIVRPHEELPGVFWVDCRSVVSGQCLAGDFRLEPSSPNCMRRTGRPSELRD